MKKASVCRTIDVMENQIFVEGKKYISAKRAAEITGYTSDYVGQLAREGHIDSKKVGRVRYVDQQQVRSYTVKSDRKKKAVETITKEATIKSGHGNKDLSHAMRPEKKSSYDKRVSVRGSFIPSPFTDEDIRSLPYTLAGLAVAILILIAPTVASTTHTTNPMASALVGAATFYKTVVFDLEDIAMEVYTKTSNDGIVALVVDSVTSASGYISGSYGTAADFMDTAPERFASREIDLSETTPMDTMKASVISGFESVASALFRLFSQ